MRTGSVTVLALFVISGAAALLPSDEAAAQGRRRSVRTPSAPLAAVVVVSDDFRFGERGWTAGFSDYSPVHQVEPEAGLRQLPSELGSNGTGFFISGHNRSDDLFMFLTKRLTASDGVRPNQQYLVTFRIKFASNVGETCFGAGGSPGAAVILRAGATGDVPEVVFLPDDLYGYYRLNVAKGDQMDEGIATTPVSSIENGTADCFSDAPFVALERTNLHRHVVTANPHGEISLLVGTDSGFEGKTSLYYQQIDAVLEPVRPAM